MASSSSSRNAPPRGREYAPSELAPLGDRARVEFVSPTRGYGLVANRPIAKDEAIVVDEAPAAATLKPGPNTRCGQCFRGEYACDSFIFLKESLTSVMEELDPSATIS